MENKLSIIDALKVLSLGTLFAFISACGSGSSASGGKALLDAAQYAGVYEGIEKISLIDASSEELLEEVENELRFVVDREGTIQFSSSGGTTGTAQLTTVATFELRSSAITQFSGLCQAGTISMRGAIELSTITATYSSDGLICESNEYLLQGDVSASRAAS